MWFTNQRRHLRVVPAPKRPVKIQIMGHDFLEVLPAHDISEGGVGIRIDHSLSDCDLKSEVELIIELPGRRPFRAKGYLRHKTTLDSFSISGIEFSSTSPEAKKALAEYVNEMVSLGRTC